MSRIQTLNSKPTGSVSSSKKSPGGRIVSSATAAKGSVSLNVRKNARVVTTAKRAR